VLPFTKPTYVKSSKQTIRNAYVLGAVGLASDQVFGVVIDNKVALEQIHPTYSLALLPLTDDITISYEDALFYADCFAYEHEIPVIAYPKKWQIEIEFLLDKRCRRDTRKTYLQDLVGALENIISTRFGPLGFVDFRTDILKYPSKTGKPFACLSYSEKYKFVSKEIHLYSFALRQIDPLAEFLCYYRVIESASKSNGLNWLEQNLGRLKFVRFGMLPAGQADNNRKRSINLFTALRHRAAIRMRELLKTMTYEDVAKRFYYTNRCGIAHGHSIRRADFSTDFREVYLDCFVIKIMARLIIEDKLSAQI
jgi:hypothetical protein